MKGKFQYRILRALMICLGVLAISGFSQTAGAADPDPARFQRSVYALHKKQINGHKVRGEEEVGRYAGVSKDYTYRDRHYYDAASGRLISHVRVDGGDPDIVHIVEVNIYDGEGRLIRDFGSISVPWSPARPINTMINFHHYNGQLHSFRQYDVFGDIKYQFCEGKLDGRAIHIALDDADLADMGAEAKTAEEYKACFDGMPSDWADYANNPR